MDEKFDKWNLNMENKRKKVWYNENLKGSKYSMVTISWISLKCWSEKEKEETRFDNLRGIVKLGQRCRGKNQNLASSKVRNFIFWVTVRTSDAFSKDCYVKMELYSAWKEDLSVLDRQQRSKEMEKVFSLHVQESVFQLLIICNLNSHNNHI